MRLQKSPLRKVSISNLSDLNAKDGASLNDSIIASAKLQLETKTVEIETKDATKKGSYDENNEEGLS